MADKEILDRVLEAILEKTGRRPFHCPICQHNDWKLDDAWAGIPSAMHPLEVSLGRMFPMAVLNCKNCGNTHFLNLLVLGFTADDFDSLEFTDSTKETKAEDG